jgi:hypothetical protein
MSMRTTSVGAACMGAGMALAACAGLAQAPPPTPTARKLTDASAAILLPAGWTATPTDIPSATAPPTVPPPPTMTATPKPTFTPKPVLTPTETFVVEGASTDDIVTQAFAAYLRKDEQTLLRLYTKEAADLCKVSYGSITKCIGVAYRVQGLSGLEDWYLLPNDPAQGDHILEFEVVITKWSNDDNSWMHLFLLEKVDGNWLITEPETKVYVYER